MKLTIITGPQGSGKTTYINGQDLESLRIVYHAERLSNYPLYLPGLYDAIKTIYFDEVESIADLHRLAAMCFDNEVRYKKHSPGMSLRRYDLDIVIATLLPKKDIQHIFKGLTNVQWIELGKEKKKRPRVKDELIEELQNSVLEDLQKSYKHKFTYNG